MCRGMNIWIEKIRAARRAGATLEEIGRAVGLSVGAVSDIEQGRTKAPRGMAAVRLAGLSDHDFDASGKFVGVCHDPEAEQEVDRAA